MKPISTFVIVSTAKLGLFFSFSFLNMSQIFYIMKPYGNFFCK